MPDQSAGSVFGGTRGMYYGATAGADMATNSDPVGTQGITQVRVTNQPPAETFVGRLLGAFGSAFISPPIAVGAASLAKGDMNWLLLGVLALGCWPVAVFFLYAGITWPKLKPSNEVFANRLSVVASSPLAWLIVCLLIAFGPALVFVGFSKQHIAQPPQVTAPPSQPGFGFNPAPQPSAAQRQVGETFSIQLAQLLAGLPKPCLIRLTGGSSTPTVEQTILWVINYGNTPSGPLCNLVQPDGLPSADEPEPKHTDQPGIVVHWKEGNVAGERIARFLGAMGLNVMKSHQMGQNWPENLVWLDVGNGYPWK
jgi:hypothetical protein